VSAGRAASTRNHYVQILKAAFRWAARKGYIARSPISEDSALVRSKHAKRSRRIPPDEEAALLKAAQAMKRTGVWLYGLIVAAIETGCRLGELLGLQWADVDLDRRELRIRCETAKDEELRRLPISIRLAAVLDMAKLDPAGRVYWPAAHVFGLLGKPVSRINKAWETCVLRAHEHEPVWTKGGKLGPESRAVLRSIDLHFHDLRHEAGSRWLEAGWGIHQVKEMLGHANISQTDTYLNAGRMGLHEAMKRFDAGRSKLPVRPEMAVGTSESSDNPAICCKPVAKKPATEHRPHGNDDPAQSDKGLLH
jgi:integrase